MNPTDFLILFVTWGLASCWVWTVGLTADGIGPAAFGSEQEYGTSGCNG